MVRAVNWASAESCLLVSKEHVNTGKNLVHTWALEEVCMSRVPWYFSGIRLKYMRDAYMCDLRAKRVYVELA